MANPIRSSGHPAGHVAAVAAPSTTRSAFPPRVATRPSPPVPGKPTVLEVKIIGADGKPVTKFDKLHAQTMHLVAVSSDLKDFMHLHPRLKSDGTLTVNATFARAVPYVLKLEYDPKGAVGALTSTSGVNPKGLERPVHHWSASWSAVGRARRSTAPRSR